MASSYDITVCPICLSNINNPKTLPCLHAFCLKCLDQYCTSKSQKASIPCPMCRTEFIRPAKSVHEFPGNSFLDRLLNEKKTLNETSEDAAVFCEDCAEESDADAPPAAVFCVDCDQKLCERCSKPHRKMKSGAHRVVPIENSQQELIAKQQVSLCDKHRKPLELYCFDCQTTICMMCFAVEHQQHKCKELKGVADEFLKQIDADVEKVSSRIIHFKKQAVCLVQENSRFLNLVPSVGNAINRSGEAVKQIIDEQVCKLLEDQRVMTSHTCKVLQSHKDDVELARSALESYVAYCVEMKSKGRLSDIANSANKLHMRAEELLKTHAIPGVVRVSDVTFTPVRTDQLRTIKPNLVGIVDQQCSTGEQLRVQTQQETVLNEQMKRVVCDVQRLKNSVAMLSGALRAAWKEGSKVDKDLETERQNLQKTPCQSCGQAMDANLLRCNNCRTCYSNKQADTMCQTCLFRPNVMFGDNPQDPFMFQQQRGRHQNFQPSDSFQSTCSQCRQLNPVVYVCRRCRVQLTSLSVCQQCDVNTLNSLFDKPRRAVIVSSHRRPDLYDSLSRAIDSARQYIQTVSGDELEQVEADLDRICNTIQPGQLMAATLSLTCTDGQQTSRRGPRCLKTESRQLPEQRYVCSADDDENN